MKKRTVFALVVVFLFLFLPSCATIAQRYTLRESVPRVARESLKSVVMIDLTSEIKADDKKTVISEEFTATGFFIEYQGRKYVLSAGHLAAEDPSGVFSAETVDGKKFSLKLLYYKGGFDGDFALFSFNSGGNISVVPLGFGDTPERGEWVIAVGAPFGVFPVFTMGLSSGLYNLGDGFTYILHSAEINPGNSGGPLLNLKGELVGMNVKSLEGTAISLAVPVENIEKYLKEAVESFAAKK